MNRFLSMVAMETMLCHSDSYTMNRNNYRVYHDPCTDKMVFMPHGMDRVLGTHRSSLDLPIVPPSLGLVTRAVLSCPEGRRCYIERAGMLFTNLFDADRLCRRVREIDAKIVCEKMRRPENSGFSGRADTGHSEDAANLCARIFERAADLSLQLAQISDLSAIPNAKFDSNGVARIEGWKPRGKHGQSNVSCQLEVKDGVEVLHLRTPQGPMSISLRNRINLPSGNYQLTGQVRIAEPDGTRRSVFLTVLRYAPKRFAEQRQRLNGREVHHGFQVSEARAPEEIELICDIRADASEVWFDASSLRLISNGGP
jgi:hypothetical protein